MELESPSQFVLESLKELAWEHRDAVELARVVCLAVRVDPAFLREARLQLLPGLSADAEADLWFSGLVDSRSAAGFVLDRDVSQWLRRWLAQDVDLLNRAWTLRQCFHPHLTPEMRLEEEIAWLALVETDDRKLNEALLLAVRAMEQGGEQALGVARWALRAIPRLPERALRTEAALALAFGTSERLGYSPTLFSGSREARLVPELLQAVRVDKVSPQMCQIGVQLRENALELLEMPAEGTWQQLKLPDTLPRFLEITWTAPEPGRRLLVTERLNLTVPLPLRVRGLTLQSFMGDVYLVQEATAGGEILSLSFRTNEPNDESKRPQENAKIRDFILTIQPWLLKKAFSLCRNQSDAEDLVQETSLRFLKSFTNVEHLPSDNLLEAWLITTMTNAFFDLMRKRRVEKHGAKDPAMETMTVAQPPDPKPLYDNISAEDLAAVMRNLSPTLRATFELRAAGYRYSEIAQAQGISPRAVGKRLSNVRQKLLELLTKKKTS